MSISSHCTLVSDDGLNSVRPNDLHIFLGVFLRSSGMPDVPGPPTTRERYPDGSGSPDVGGVEVSWNGLLPNNTGPVLYAVQLQQHVNTPMAAGGHHPHRGTGATGNASKQHGMQSSSTSDGVDTSSSVSTRWLQVAQVREID